MNGQTWPVSSHAEVLAVAARPYPEETTKPTKLDVFVDRLPHYPFLEEAMTSDKTTAYPRGRQRIGGLICSYGRLKIRIEEAAAWGSEMADAAFLEQITTLYDLLGVGAYPTPGGLGMSTMESAYLAARYPRQSRPSQALRAALIEHRIGGRSDWTDSDETYAQVWEADQHNAYCSAAALPLPVGSVTRFLEGEVAIGDTTMECLSTSQSDRTRGRPHGESAADRRVPCSPRGDSHWDSRMGVQPSGQHPVSVPRGSEYATWYARCVCFNSRRQENSPVLERSGSGRLIPFTHQGYLTCWLWKEEADAFTKRPGCYVEVLDGWGWTQLEPVLKPWAERMHAVRADAAKVSVDLERMVKFTIVAAIGRHGCRPERRSVIPLIQASEGDVVLSDTLDGEWATHTEPEPDACWNTVWHDYIVMQIRLMNYMLQVAEAARDNPPLGSNVDAIYFLVRPAVAHEPDLLGGWRIRDKHGVRFPYARGLLSLEKTSLPGIPRGSPLRKELTSV